MLILNLKNKYKELKIKKKDVFSFNDKTKAYILLSGKIIAYGERDYTQLLKSNDPIGFAESLLARDKVLKYKRLTDITLLEFYAKKIRESVNNSCIPVQALIKYSLARIFAFSNSYRKSHYLFEDKFVYKNWKYLDTRTYNEDAIIFPHGSSAKNMYFIEKGKVKLISKENKLIKILNSGESFGEIALLRGRKRYNSAISITHTTLKIIKSTMIAKVIGEEEPLVQLALISLAKKLEIINGIRSIDHHKKLQKEGLLDK